MGRQTKRGIDFFSLDVDFEGDVKLYILETETIGYATLIAAWQTIYRNNGYYAEYTKDFRLLIKDLIKADEVEIKRCLDIAIGRGLFDQRLCETYNVLTSRGIQSRYFNAAKRKAAIRFNPEYALIDMKNFTNLQTVAVSTQKQGLSGSNCKQNSPNCNSFATKEKEKEKEKEKVYSERVSADINSTEKMSTSAKFCTWVADYLAEKNITILTGFMDSPVHIEAMIAAGWTQEKLEALYRFVFESKSESSETEKQLIFHQRNMASAKFGGYLSNRAGDIEILMGVVNKKLAQREYMADIEKEFRELAEEDDDWRVANG